MAIDVIQPIFRKRAFRAALIAAAIFVNSSLLQAQRQADYLPPTPTVAALGKYVDAPVSLATGTPEISIPVYEIAVGDFKLPISLSYHAGGFRVTEESSWVGLGWSVTGPGVITRTIRHLIDNSTRDAFFDSYRGHELDVYKLTDYLNLAKLADSKGNDGLPDLYVFNFGQYSGKFVVINDVKLLPKQPLKITKSISSSAWTIVDPEGNTYYFREVESAKTRSTNTASTQDISWYLSKILTAKKQEIVFEYKSTQFFQSVNISQINPYKQTRTGRYELEEPVSNSFTTTLYGKELSKITFPHGTVEFISSYDRADINKPQGTAGALRLTGIKVADKQGNILKMLHLRHDYFNPTATAWELKRLKLTAVEEDMNPQSETSKSAELKIHTFEYNTGVELPSKFSKSQDHWGYFNYKSNGSLAPLLKTANRSCDPASNLDLEPTRNTDSEAVKACMLTRINYPTGGYTDYTYEINDYGYVGDVPLRPTQEKVNYQEYQPVFVMAYTNRSEFTPSTRDTESKSFTIPIEQCVRIVADIRYPTEWIDGARSQAKLELYAGTNTGTPPNPTPARAATPNLLATYTVLENGENFITLSPGTYTLKAIGTMDKSIARGEVRYADFQLTTIQKKPAGGVRIKKIVEHDGVNPNVTRTFTYHDNQDPSKSSGSIIAEPDYFNWLHYFEEADVDEGHEAPTDFCRTSIKPLILLEVTSESTRGLGSGNHIGYREVQVHYGEQDENGKTVSTFTTPPNLTHGTESDVSWRRGLLLSQQDFDRSGRLIKQIRNEYGIGLADTYYGIVVNFAGRHPCWQPTTNEFLQVYPVYFKQTISIMQSETYVLKKQTVDDFDVNTGKSLTTVEEYFYDNPAHLQVTRTRKQINDKRYITFTSYPHDFTGGNTAIADLKLSNVIVPIETVVWQEDVSGANTRILSGQLLAYKTGGMGLLQEIKQLEIAAPLATWAFKFAHLAKGVLPAAGTTGSYSPYTGYQPAATYSYNTQGNPIEVTTEESISTAYIWGYQGEYAIAKVENARVTQCAFTSFENDGEGGWNAYTAITGNARTGQKSFQGNLTKSALPADTYVVSLWAKQGSGTPSISGVAPQSVGQPVQGWVPYRWELQTSGNLTIRSNGSSIDDVRLHPAAASMTSFSYEPLKGLISITDANGIDTRYQYDRAGRVLAVRDGKGNILKTYTYHYKR